MLFKVKNGEHRGRDKKVYKKGDIIESKADLRRIFRGKFREVHGKGPSSPEDVEKPKIPGPADEGGEDKEVASPPKSDTTEKPSEYGVKVTSEFPTAKKVKLDVYRKAFWHVVVDPENGNVLNDKKLRKKDVEPFLAQYREG